ncbi:MAG: glycine--tRNA ligase subunit beta, partial [Myxococcales bacterium]|nr:glycine--tRNA ligase subunit beta [Myxococcales bacterium]
AFGADGAPTKAALGFAAKNGVDPAALEQAEVEGKKGLYVVANRHVVGRPATEVLPAALEALIAAVPWPKSMRWGWGELGFVRPVHWLVCLLGGEVLPLRYAGASAGRTSRGHRFLAPGPIELTGADGYADALRAAFVVVDVAARRDLISAELRRVEVELGAVVRPDPELLAEVTNLVEYPVAVAGGFAPDYLEVPEEVIVTAMRTHQRYFAVQRPDAAGGGLAPRFVTIAGTVVRDAAVVAAGNERAVSPRLADAQFFFREDRKKPLADHGAALADVVFLAKLGTVGAKIARVAAVAAGVAVDHLGADRGDLRVADVERAARLAKADLATGVVGEFPELQGVMGGHYARLGGEPEAVWRAIPDHYRPRGAGDELPASEVGAIVGIADRIDTIVGCFAVDLEPTGSADPFGLRRAALAILQILLDRGPGGARHQPGTGWPLGVDALITRAAHHLRAAGIEVTPTDVGEVREFFRARLRGILIDEGIAAQDVDAALGAGWDDPCDARLRARDLAVVPREAREVFKRIANILDDAAEKGLTIGGDVDPGRFVADDNVEHRLWRAVEAAAPRLDEAVAAHAYRRMFAVLVELQPAVAAFFDRGGVMVMDPDPTLRDNRLSLLQRLLRPFAQVADFRQLAVQA